MLLRFLIVVVSVCLSACSKSDININKYARLHYDLKCIWDAAPHCAFTSLVEYDGKLYCCFREADAHMPYGDGGYGVVRILESQNGNNWYSVCTVEDVQCDLRDPYLSVTPDNRLMLVCGRVTVNNDGNLVTQASRVCFFDSSESIYNNNYKVSDVNIENSVNHSSYWLWKVKWHNNAAYGVAYNNQSAPILVKSLDGVNFSIITNLDVYANEADIEFVNNNMIIVCRSIDQSHNGYVGYSEYPHMDWNWTELNHLIQSPELIAIGKDLILSARSTTGTTIYNVIENEIYPIITMPSDGDSGYPGMLYDKYSDKLLVSYYTTPSTTKIYLAKMSLSGII